jgi:transcriptional regulator GlxA family with amidase domain
VFLTDVLRHYLAANRADRSAGAIPPSDPDVAAAVALMRDLPQDPWTIASLARHVGMSLSSFAARFRAATGNSPITYLTRVRLAQAAGALAVSTRPPCRHRPRGRL